MNGFAFLGIILIIYAGIVFFISFKKPEAIWNMSKIKIFRNRLGEKGTVVFFVIWGLLAIGLGVWLMTK